MHLDDFIDRLLLIIRDEAKVTPASEGEFRESIRLLAATLVESARPRWRYPEEEVPEDGEWVVFVTDQCAYRLGRFGYDNLSEQVIFLDQNERPYLTQHVLMWHPLPILPPSIACDLPGIR